VAASRIEMRHSTRFLFLSALAVVLVACGDDDPVEPMVSVRPHTEAGLLDSLEGIYRGQEGGAYADLLAEDFRFYFDPDTRDREQLPEFWDRPTDSLHTARLLGSEYVIEVKINLTINQQPQAVSGEPRWSKLVVDDAFLEVLLGGTEEFPDGITLQIDGQAHSFFFRRGRTEGDTLAASSTADNLYFVKWQDHGQFLVSSSDRTLTRVTTWGGIKTLFRDVELSKRDAVMTPN
jgi:hypothetical protein